MDLKYFLSFGVFCFVVGVYMGFYLKRVMEIEEGSK